jgi:hypothetical protein
VFTLKVILGWNDFFYPEDWADIPPLRKDFRIKGR